MTELVGGLRVALPGVQVLFAFLLTVPFNQRFAATRPPPWPRQQSAGC